MSVAPTATSPPPVTENVPAALEPAKPYLPGNDPQKGWDRVTNQLARVGPTRVIQAGKIRDQIMPSIKV